MKLIHHKKQDSGSFDITSVYISEYNLHQFDYTKDTFVSENACFI